MWQALRNRRLGGYKFRRQRTIGPYVVDFVCLDAGLVIECDGGQHAHRKGKDDVRTAFIEDEGFRVLRFWNNEVTNHLPGVLEVVLTSLRDASPSPRHSPRGGEWEVKRDSISLSPRGEG
ncbi:MAG: DUF559 domain-containing protein [Pseudomonadota bacterium]